MSEILDKSSSKDFQPDELGSRLRRANAALAEIPPEESVPTELQLEVESLDHLWVYGSAECAFSGLCLIVRSDKSLEDRPRLQKIDVAVGDTDGFWIMRFDKKGKEQWAVAWGFGTKEHTEGSTDIDVGYYIDTRERHEVVPVSEIESAFQDNPVSSEACKLITDHSEVFAQAINGETFLSMDIDQQKQFIDTKLQYATSEVKKLGYNLTDMAIAAIAERAYVLKHDYQEIDLGGNFMSGQSKGLMALPRRKLAMGEQIIDPDQLVDCEAGFCIVISIDDDTADRLHLQKGQEIYLPASGQGLAVELGDPH